MGWFAEKYIWYMVNGQYMEYMRVWGHMRVCESIGSI